VSEAPTSIRFPRELRERVAARAATEHRTLSGPVPYLVEQALGPESPREPDPGGRVTAEAAHEHSGSTRGDEKRN
jgi:hypothetical protein